MSPDTAPATPPTADGEDGLAVLRALWRERSPLAALVTMHRRLGAIFRISLPGFRPIVLVGPVANRELLVSRRHDFAWRTPTDPVTRLLRHGVLVVDADEHDRLRDAMMPALQRRAVLTYVPAMLADTDRVLARWRDGATIDMLVEMRRLALLILMRTLFGVDMGADVDRLWPTILKVLQYISPGAWIIWPGLPRFGYRRALREMDDYLYGIIRARRAATQPDDDMLSHLIAHSEWGDDLIRDQLLTMLIAGHDTSTALLAWALYLLGRHPDVQAAARAEVDSVVGSAEPTADTVQHLDLLDSIIKETLRLYPPIHVGNRRAPADCAIVDHHIPAEARVMYSIYATHRDPAVWDEPDAFRPNRFHPDSREKHPPFSYVPFGGGPRNCIGAAFGQIESRLVLARILQRFTLTLERDDVHPHMGATLEPRPGVRMRLHARRPGDRDGAPTLP